ncbi:MAG: chitobiase/beta-hexosaminidase C-terminal domain-containing protein, partial [Akkermansiaceae bacterium]|nr:chitobiase/beta-hexosaminidase C-terminal domain-containing protein [Akkermansiaceae bacterium]
MTTTGRFEHSAVAAGLLVALACGGAAFAAPPVANPTLWLTAEAGVVDDGSGGIERWEDQSGNGYHFEQATAGKRPRLLANGLSRGEGEYAKYPLSLNGNSTWGGSLGSDFIVEEEVVVTQLGAFDHNRDGFSNPVTVQVWQRNDGGTPLSPADDTAGVLLEEMIFTPADPGTLDGSHRWKSLATPRTLAPGSYTIFAWGYTGTDYYASNPTTAGAPPRGIRAFGSGRYSNNDQPSQWPQNTNYDYYRGAGNFRFYRSAAAVGSLPAVQFDGSDDGLQAVAALDLGKPSTVFIAYQRTNNDFGYILQNSSGPHWFIRSDGYYNNGWIRYGEIPWGVTQADVMLTTGTGTRVWRNLDDLTQTEGLAAGTPNRLALGGGNGIGNDPIQVKITEVIAYDRQLSEAEILTTQNYLGQRYGIFEPVAITPEVLPLGDLGSGSVAVTITSGTAGAEVRYTTDGTEPTVSSTLYGGSFSVPRGTLVKARAFAAGLAASGVASQYYGNAEAAELPVTGAAMWLRADRGVETDFAGKVARWRDLTGSGNDVVQASPWQRPGVMQAFSKNGGYAILSPETAGEFTHGGTLGADFVVTESLEVTELGAHDANGDGFGGAVTVQIWTRDDRGTPDYPEDDIAGALVAEMEFTSADPGGLVGLKRYKPLAAPVTLAPGAYSVLAWGFVGVNTYKNSSDAYWNEEGLRFAGKSRYSGSNGTWPTTMDGHPVKYNGAGNFRYRKTAAAEVTRAAVAFDGADDGLWAAATSNLTRPSTVYVVFDQADYGHIIQSTANGWWFMRSDGAYADGWVVNRYFGYNRTHIAGMTAESGSTRFYLNGEDWTVNPSVGNAPPGRLALGGGNGYSIDPSRVKIAEVVAFNRVLTQGERWQVENYLAGRYKSQPVALPPVVVSPASNYGSGSVTVSLSHPVAGAVIHYTTDGSVPTTASAVYSGDFSVPRSTRVRAIALLGGSQTAVIGEAFYGAAGDSSDLPVAGARMWLRAEVGVETDASGRVSRWRDLTGNGNDLLQELSGARPNLLADGFNRGNLTAIQVSDGNGAHNYGGSLGEDFVVTAPLEVTHLGAFDHLRDGFAGTIAVQLWSRNDNGTPDNNSDDTAGSLLGQLTFTAAAPGTLEGPLRFKPLAAPLTLAPGAYTVFAWGYNGADQYYEGTRSVARNDSRFRFVGNSRYTGTGGAWPSAIDNNFLDYNGAANFKVSAGSALPVRPAVAFDGADDGLKGVESMNIGRPSTVLMVFRKEGGDSGYMLQNSGGGNWWFRNDGFYSDGWVRNESFATGRLTLAAMANSPTSTRAYVDGFEVTSNSALTSPAPGRLVMGGGGGQQDDPVATRVTELVVYDRILNPSEMWQVQSYLASRHGIYQIEVDAPTILPVAGYGSGDVEVTLASTTPGAAIRYTLDGAEPTSGATLYAGPFTVPRDTKVRARAFLDGAAPSPVASSYYGQATSHPLPVTDAALWLRGDSGVDLRDDGTVVRWRDLSGNGRDALPTRWTTAPGLAKAAVGGAAKIVTPLPAGLVGNTNYSGAIGTDFRVDEAVEITHLGVFDSGTNGIAGSITVRLHRVDDNGTPDNLGDDSSAELLATQAFTNAAPGTLEGSLRFIPLASPLSLLPGRYLIESSGWTGADSYMGYDSYEETRYAGISFYDRSRYNSSPASSMGGTVINDNRYLAASSFKFRKPGATGVARDAVRFDGVNDGLLGPADFLLGRPATIFMVFNQLNGADGRLLQSGNGNNFLLGPHIGVDGLYCDGWVTQHTILRNQHSHVVGVYEGSRTRYFYNGQELTQVPGYTGVMGRLALGGAEGTYFQPCNADLAELVIYNRLLSEAERQQVSSALAVQYHLPLEPILPPVASPDGGYYATGQTLVYSHPIPGVEIRYTTDGSEPTESSALASGPLVVAASGTFKAKAFKAGYLPSPMQESVFAIDPLATHMPQRSALQLWLRAGVNTETDGSVVTLWRDLSGNGMDAGQSAAVSRPTLNASIVGGAPGVVFDGTDDFLKLPAGFANFSQGLTAIVVARPNVAQYWERFFDLGNGNDSANIFLARRETTNNFAYGVYTAGWNKQLYGPDAMLTATNAIYTVTQQPTGAVKIHHNGSLIAEDASFPLPTNIKRHSNLIGESNWPWYDGVYSGAISEIILYNSALNDLDRETLEAAVRARYGIASTATATVAFSPDPAQLYPSGVAVTLTCVTPDSQIRYTLDGSQPDETSPLYSAPLQVNSSTRIRARAFTEGFNPSPFSEATYFVGQPPSSGDGFLGTYFDNIDFTGASLTRVDPTINFDWGGGSPDPAIGGDEFSVRWTGKLMPRFSENYTFYTASDDGQRLWVDLNRDGDFEDAGEFLIDDWTLHGETERASAPVPLVAGQLYDFKMEMYENYGGAVARLRWSSFSEPKAIIPQSQGFSNAQFAQTVSTPVISPAGGTYTAAVDVTIATATTGATIYYTTDGSIPDTNSQVYGGAFPIGADATVRARAYKAGFNPSGVASTVYDIDAQPPLINLFAWDGVAINDGETFTAKGTFTAQATDNQGVGSVEFYYRPAGAATPLLVGRDTWPHDGWSAAWDIAPISDGAYTVIVRVYDVAGAWSEQSRSIQVALATPLAPVIVSPASGVTVQDPVVPLQITAQPFSNLRLFRDNVLVFSGYASGDGSFNYSPSLPTGSSVFKVVAVNRAGSSPDSNAITVNRVREFPQLQLAFDSNTLVEGAPVTGTVTLPAAEAQPLTVQVTTNKASQVMAVEPVVIPAGATTGTFILSARQDTEIELLTSLTVTAAAVEHRSATAELFLGDDDYPTIELTIDQSSVTESHGTVVGVLRRAQVSDRALRVTLQNSNPSEATTPEFVDIPANQTEAAFSITVINDTADDDNQLVNLRGVVFVGATGVAQTAQVTLEVRD